MKFGDNRKGYLNSWLCLICFSFTGRLLPFRGTVNEYQPKGGDVLRLLYAYNLHENVLFSNLILGSFFSDFGAYYGDLLIIKRKFCNKIGILNE